MNAVNWVDKASRVFRASLHLLLGKHHFSGQANSLISLGVKNSGQTLELHKTVIQAQIHL